MLMQMQGIVHGKQIELERAPDLPPGSMVLVQIQPQSLTLAEKHKLVDLLCGAWSGDPSLKPIFDEIEKQRTVTKPREVTLDVAS